MFLPSPDRPLRIGTRGSPLALAQAYEARERLMVAHGLPERAFEVVVIKTTGDKVTDRPLGEIGGKGLFTREIEEALLAGNIDIAVHSMKDMPTALPEGLAIPCLLPREDVRDAFVSLTHASLAAMPAGAVVGTSSLRRRAQLMHRRPDLKVVEFRGNVQTRLRKLDEGIAEATFLAVAGLRRLGRPELIRAAIEPEEMLPAVAQGAIGVELRVSDANTHDLLAPVHDPATRRQLAAERAFLAALDGSCRTPIGGLAEIAGGRLHFRGEIIRPDGSERLAAERTGPPADGAAMGADAAAELRAKAGPGFFET
jgi:hydroxymethylbilane synthase